ncbi:MAG: hypothetical protein ACEQSA_00555 [Weeksellaceae bacterium]
MDAVPFSTKITLQTYRSLQQATDHLLGQYPDSRAFFDLTRSAKAKEAYSQWQEHKTVTPDASSYYLTNAINPVGYDELSQNDITKLNALYGDGSLKVRLLDQNFYKWLNSSHDPRTAISAGGACALETIDVRTLQYLKKRKNSKKLINDYLEYALHHFPSWTQITGALIPSQGVSIFYDETFPWYLNIEQHGISDAKLKTQTVYDNIFACVSRYAKLHNPQNVLVRVPFSQLKLDQNNYLLEWFDEFKIYLRELEQDFNVTPDTYDPNTYLKLWIEYTYSGPRIHELNLDYIKRFHKDIYYDYQLETSTIHIRAKQIDHLDVERPNKWMHSIVLNTAEKQNARIQTLMQNPRNRMGAAAFMWMRDHSYEHPHVGLAGFLDFTNKGKLLHEESLQSLNNLDKLDDAALLNELFNSPLRLHSDNIAQVEEFLGRFRAPYSVSFSKSLLVEIETLRKKIIHLEKKIDKIEQFMDQEQKFLNHLRKSTTLTENDISLLNKRLSDHIFKKNTTPTEQSLLPIDKTNSKFILLLKALLKDMYNKDKKRRTELNSLKLGLIKQVKLIWGEVSNKMADVQSDNLTQHIAILPLVDNMFVSYMQQLLFIPVIRDAYLDMVRIEKEDKFSLETKENHIIDIISQIYPYIISCIRYIYGKTDYPWAVRYEAQYKSPY